MKAVGCFPQPLSFSEGAGILPAWDHLRPELQVSFAKHARLKVWPQVRVFFPQEDVSSFMEFCQASARRIAAFRMVR